MMAREAARITQCQNNIRQIALATLAFESSHQRIPQLEEGIPCELNRVGETQHAWSVFTRLLSHLQSEVADELKRDKDWSQDVSGNGPLTLFRPSVYRCPSIDDVKIVSYGGDPHMSISYAVCWGTWKKGETDRKNVNAGLYSPNNNLKVQAFRDGVSNTIAFAEVLPGIDYFEARGCETSDIPMPLDPPGFTPNYQSQDSILHRGLSHTQWVDARPVQTGFTTWATPNTILTVPSHGMLNGNWLNIEIRVLSVSPCILEGGSCPPTKYHPEHFGIVSRSNHAGSVNASMLGGSVLSIDSRIDIKVWRALSTRNGSDSIGEYD